MVCQNYHLYCKVNDAAEREDLERQVSDLSVYAI